MPYRDMVKQELQIASYELRVESLKARVEIQKCKFKSTSYEFKSTSYEFESTRIFKSMETQLNSEVLNCSATREITCTFSL